MSTSLFGLLSMGSESLANSRIGVDVTGHNISNAHTPGYSRQTVSLESKDPVRVGTNILGNGAKVATVARSHDKYLEMQIRKEVQNAGQKETLSKELGKLEGLFNPELTATIRERLGVFFNACRELANFPEEPAVRTNLVESGENLAQSFRATHNSIMQIQKDATDQIRGEVGMLNQRLNDVARLNQEIKELQLAGRDTANDLLDKRDIVIKEIGETININVYNDANTGICIRGPGDLALVDGNECARLSMNDKVDSDRPAIILEDARGHNQADITKKITGGRLGGLAAGRDQYGQELRDSINRMARDFAEQFNSVHRQGYGLGDYSESNGRNFFSGIELGEAAQTIEIDSLISHDVYAISAGMTARAPGDNIIANELIRVGTEPIFDEGKASVSDYYDRVIARLGVDSMRVGEDAKAAKILMGQLDGMREQVAGVSLDEEAANLLKYQHLFTASSRVITTADELFKTLLDLKR